MLCTRNAALQAPVRSHQEGRAMQARVMIETYITGL
jgi:hypothetical protein